MTLPLQKEGGTCLLFSSVEGWVRVGREMIETTTQRPTFAQLCELEPGLSRLLAEAKAEKAAQRADRRYCANRVWYRRFKWRLLALVGWERPDKHPVLSSTTAYDVAYRTIYDNLPNCRHRGPFC
jgi:hypothetical protein